MAAPAGPPRLPLLRLRCSRADHLRALLERQPQWGVIAPAHEQVAADAAVVRYRLQPQSFFVEVRWRRERDEWVERDFLIVPGAVVALRLVLGDRDPARISSLLDLPPSRAWRQGSGDGPPSVRREGLWIHEVLPDACVYAEEKVQELLALLRSRPGLRDVLADPEVRWAGVTVQFRGCRERMGGLSLDRAVLEDLVALSLQLDVEVGAE